MKPARPIVQRSPHRTVGAVHMPSLQAEPIEWESFRERAFIRLAVLCPDLRRLEFQPFGIEYRDGEGQSRTYTPDFLLTLASGRRVVVEVKTEPYVEQFRQVYNLCSPILKDRGCAFYVVTDRHMDARREDRAELIRRYARSAVPSARSEQVLALVRHSARGIGYRQLLQAGVTREEVFHLVGRRALIATPSLEILESTVLNLVDMETIDDCFQFDRWFGCSPWGANLSA